MYLPNSKRVPKRAKNLKGKSVHNSNRPCHKGAMKNRSVQEKARSSKNRNSSRNVHNVYLYFSDL